MRPGKPGFANRCPACSEPEATESTVAGKVDPGDRKSASEMNEARRKAIRDMLYRGDS